MGAAPPSAGDSGRGDDVRAVEANTEAYWLTLGTLGRNARGARHVGADLSWVYTGYPVLNRVVGARLAATEADARVAGIVARFRAWNAGVTWVIGPSTRPTSLGPLLEGHGFTYAGAWFGMVLDLTPSHSVPAAGRPGGAPGPPRDFLVRPADDRETADDWLRIVGDAFRLSRPAHNVFRALPVGETAAEDAMFLRYVGFVAGRPVCTATLFVSPRAPDAAGVYLVGTTPGARGRGFGTAITRHVLAEARTRGYRRAVLQATEAGRPLYRALGFDECATIGLYRWAAAGRLGVGRWLRWMRTRWGMRRGGP